MMNMAKILYTDKKLICYVTGKLQNIVLYFDFQYIQEPFCCFSSVAFQGIQRNIQDSRSNPRGLTRGFEWF